MNTITTTTTTTNTTADRHRVAAIAEFDIIELALHPRHKKGTKAGEVRIDLRDATVAELLEQGGKGNTFGWVIEVIGWTSNDVDTAQKRVQVAKAAKLITAVAKTAELKQRMSEMLTVSTHLPKNLAQSLREGLEQGDFRDHDFRESMWTILKMSELMLAVNEVLVNDSFFGTPQGWAQKTVLAMEDGVMYTTFEDAWRAIGMCRAAIRRYDNGEIGGSNDYRLERMGLNPNLKPYKGGKGKPRRVSQTASSKKGSNKK